MISAPQVKLKAAMSCDMFQAAAQSPLRHLDVTRYAILTNGEERSINAFSPGPPHRIRRILRDLFGGEKNGKSKSKSEKDKAKRETYSVIDNGFSWDQS